MRLYAISMMAVMLTPSFIYGATPDGTRPPTDTTDVPIEIQLHFLEVAHDGLPAFGLSVPRQNDSFSVVRGKNLLASILHERSVNVLSNPIITTISKRPAAFFAGGEFPYPERGDDGTVTIRFREFGDRVEIVPTPIGKQHVRLQFEWDIAKLDTSKNVTIDDLHVPGISRHTIQGHAQLLHGETVVMYHGVRDDVDDKEAAGRARLVLVTPRIHTPSR